MKLSDLIVRYREERDYSCVMVPLTGELRKTVLALSDAIPDDVLAEKGRELDPHITLVYGLHTDKSSAVEAVLKKMKRPVRFRLGAVGVFVKDGYDVLKVQVISPDLMMLNAFVRVKLPNTTEYQQYRPHVTLAYVKSGEGMNLARRIARLDLDGVGDEVVFSDRQGNKTTLSLARESAGDQVADQVMYATDEKTDDATDHVDGNGFLISDHPGTVVKGHTPTDMLTLSPNKIGDMWLWLAKDHKRRTAFADKKKRNDQLAAYLGLRDSKHPDFAAAERESRDMAGLEGRPVPPHVLWQLTNGKVGSPIEQADWRSQEMIPEDFYAMRHDDSPVKYEDEPELKAHHNVKGFQIEHALRHLATDPNFTSDGQQLAKTVLTTGQPEALWGLSDELNASNHPLADKYNWMGAASKLHLDGAVGHLIESVRSRMSSKDKDRDVLGQSVAHRVVEAVNNSPSHEPDDYHSGTQAQVSSEGLNLLHEQGHTAEDIRDSLDRHANRIRLAHIANVGIIGPDELKHRALVHDNPFHDEQYRKIEVPEKYRSSPALSDFIHAVRQVRSTNQDERRKIATEQMKKLKLDMQALRDAIADSPQTASANVAYEIAHKNDYDRVRAAASLYGLQTNSPSLLLFHEGDGPDSLHKFDVVGSAEKLRRKMDEFGLTTRTLFPTQTGWSCTVFSPNNVHSDKVRAFAQQMGLPLQTSTGQGELIGGGSEAEGDENTRTSYRSIIRKWEKQQNANIQQQPADSVRSGARPDPRPAGTPTARPQTSTSRSLNPTYSRTIGRPA